MDLEFTITAEDYIDAARLNMAPRTIYRVAAYVILALYLLAIAFSLWIFINTGTGLGSLLTIVGSLIVVLFYFVFALPRGLRRIYAQQKLLHDPIHMTLTESGMAAKCPHGRSEIPWNLFHKWREGKKMLLLYQSDAIFHMFPKRIFRSPKDIDWMRRTLIENIGIPLK